jgi:hypothetical protein
MDFTFTQFAANIKALANTKQAELFAKADALDAAARNAPLESAKRRRLNAEANAIRDEAFAIGDRYHGFKFV